ncbi:MAG TPA: hypothetical protein PK706_00695 [Xanthobacteraceae bacterium]|nr:hypothetical protein [Xanthobacteraceae bacterium]
MRFALERSPLQDVLAPGAPDRALDKNERKTAEKDHAVPSNEIEDVERQKPDGPDPQQNRDREVSIVNEEAE